MSGVQNHTLEYVVVDVPATIWKQHRFRAWLVFDGHDGLRKSLANLKPSSNIEGTNTLEGIWELHVISYL